MPAPKSLASLSLDLDNKWSYLKTHGDAGWQSLPSYLNTVVPRALDVLRRKGLRITFFVVGLDAAQDESRPILRSIAEGGHEIGNHSFKHEPWLHLYSQPELETELSQAEENIEAATGQRPVGFRGPGFSFSQELLALLKRRGYVYDASTFPTFLGPLARTYYFMRSRLSSDQAEERKGLFGSFKEGFRSNKMYLWKTAAGDLAEVPVTTMPWFRVPIHVSYLLYLAGFSPALARTYFSTAMQLCRLNGVQPSLLLHPLDFLGGDDDKDLSFFPAMNLKGEFKVDFVASVLQQYAAQFEVLPLVEHVRRAAPH
jgi:hypothetical protein